MNWLITVSSGLVLWTQQELSDILKGVYSLIVPPPPMYNKINCRAILSENASTSIDSLIFH
jgi:hypothetical protein